MTAAPRLIVDSESFTDDQCLGGIEVEFEVTALEGASVVHRISLSPREERNEEKKEADFGDSGQYSYFQESNSNEDQSLEHSFDSTDEIKENSKLIGVMFYGDNVKRRLDIQQTPTPSSRVGIIASEQKYSTSSPTETHISSFDIAKEEFQPIKTKLDLLVEMVKKFEDKMKLLGAPYTPGRFEN